MMDPVTVLGLESSCDDTAAAVVRGKPGGAAKILSSIVFDQQNLHKNFGGVVPEIAARAHAEKIDLAAKQALDEAGLNLQYIDAIAVTAGPGLIGGVMSGVMCAKGLAIATGKPLFGVNHLAGHALTPRLIEDIPFPYLMLLVSGGHCQFLIVHSPVRFERLGGTIDDAPGEAFDKVARLLGLPQPGGPMIEMHAQDADRSRFKFPRALLDRPGCDLSFSGLKTAVLRARDTLIDAQSGLTQQDRADLCACFQDAVSDVLAKKTRRAIERYARLNSTHPSLCVAGGVAANLEIRQALKSVATDTGCQFIAPPMALCTDNAAMIAFAAIDQMPHRTADGMDLIARPRWPLDSNAPAMLGSGKKGAKA
ncbi:MAG: tRNA (adenosine(37)-N6)-threonylcarbamoyltransferase complex transferase subunit TsaD [Paracoccaceae bacterium]